MERFRKVLYIESRLEGPWRGFTCAVELAHRNGASLTAVASMPGVAAAAEGVSGWDAAGAAQVHQARAERWRARLERLAAEAAAAGVAVRTRVVDGESGVWAELEEGGYDLVMKVSEPVGSLSPWRLDRWDRRLVRDSGASVWLLDPAQGSGLDLVLAAVSISGDDGEGALSRSVLRIAASLAERTGAELRVVHAWSLLGESVLARPSSGGSRARLKRRLSAARRERARGVTRLLEREVPGSGASLVLRKGEVVGAIRAEAWRTQADVVVVGEGGGGWGLPFFPGVAERVAARAPASVLVVKAGAVAAGARLERGAAGGRE